MKSSLFATAALVAGAVAEAGSAIVINKCKYDVYLFNTPSANGGYSDINKVLSPNGQYSQKYTELSNGNGWSIKLSKLPQLSNNILQYEYTFHDDGTIWYDLSEVDGNPWYGNWEIVSNSPTCAPKQQAYRYATDDAYGMQACPDDVTITVTLCSGESQNDAAASSVASSVASVSSSAVRASTNPVASTTAAAPSSFSGATATTVPVVSTTMITSLITSAAKSSDAVLTVTKASTTTFWTRRWGPPSKRDAHAHHHAARHPHAQV